MVGNMKSADYKEQNYQFKTNINYRDNISVVDSIGKFVIGDSIANYEETNSRTKTNDG